MSSIARVLSFLSAILIAIGFTAGGVGAQRGSAPRVTFTEHVAPILYGNCVTCHRPGEEAPFALITYEDVTKRAKLIAKVTQSRFMPPWHAVHGYGDFLDERGLTEAQIGTIRDWVGGGMVRGPAAKMPQLPRFTEGWHLGAPDLVLEMPEGYAVPADGPDVYRNFVLPTGLLEDRWVRAVEFRPGTRQVVHHALFQYIRGGAAASLAGADGKPGFGGAMPIGLVPGFAPAGEIGSWAVGATPHALPDGLAWPLPKGSDLVLQLHLHPTGKPETERSKIGIFFAQAAPERKIREMGAPGLFGLLAGLDIPPGATDHRITGTLTLPADMLALSVTAHAHYLGKEFKATASLPDGSTVPLLWIRDWDFNWQDRYFYRNPVRLPQGTRIDVSISFDNSADNPRNPCTPPRRVQWGLQSTDEMGGVRFQMVPADAAAEAKLQETLLPAVRAGLQKAAQSEEAKAAAQRYAQQQARFREAATGTRVSACGGSEP